MKALKDQGLQDASINEATQKRYLALGRCVQSHKHVLMRWEMFHQRDSLVDSISTMRHLYSVSDREEDLAYIFNDLFLQQRAGLRSSLITPKIKKKEVKTPQNVGRSFLIKRMVLNHLIETCPNLAPIVQPFVDSTHYELQYGVETNGERTQEVSDDDHVGSGHELIGH